MLPESSSSPAASASSSSIKTALYTAMMIFATSFYVSGTISNIGTLLARSVSLWEVCSSATTCTTDFSASCSEGQSIIAAAKAMCIISCCFGGIAVAFALYDFFYPATLTKSCNLFTAIITIVFGLAAMSFGWILFAASICSGTTSFNDAGYSIGAQAPLLVTGVVFNMVAIIVHCYAPWTTETEETEREMKKKEAKKKGMRPPPRFVPTVENKNEPTASTSTGGRKNKKNRTSSTSRRRNGNEFDDNNYDDGESEDNYDDVFANNNRRSNSTNKVKIPPPPPSPRSQQQQQQSARLSRTASNNIVVPPSPSRDAITNALSRTNSANNFAFYQQQQQQNAVNHQQQQLYDVPQDGEWILDDESGLYWSQVEQLWFDDQTGFFIDPNSGQSYDPSTGEWSG